MLVSGPLEDPLGCVTLLRRPLLVVFQSRVDSSLPGTQLRPLDRVLPLIPRRRLILSILPTVFRARPNSRAAARRPIPPTNIARRTLAYPSNVFVPPVSHRKHAPFRPRTCLGTPMKTCLPVKLQSGGWSTFTPPLHAANAALRGLFMLRRLQGEIVGNFLGQALCSLLSAIGPTVLVFSWQTPN